MLLAENLGSNINWSLIALVVTTVATMGMWLDARKSRVMQISPQPFEVAATPPGNSELQMSVKQLNARVKVLEQWRNDLITKLDDDKTEILLAGDERARRIYTHVEDVRKELDHKLSALPNELVALLKNTGSI